MLGVSRNKAWAGKKKIKSEGGYLPCGRRPVSQTGGDIMLIIGQASRCCCLKLGWLVREIYLAAESQANEVLEFVAMLKAEFTNT